MSDTTNQQTEPTEKELQEYRENMKKYYDVQIGLLKKQKEYEVLLADIEEARAKRISMNIRIAQMMAPPPEKPTEEEMADAQSRMKEAIEEESKSTKTRNLKKQ
jgi:hypothetical protein